MARAGSGRRGATPERAALVSHDVGVVAPALQMPRFEVAATSPIRRGRSIVSLAARALRRDTLRASRRGTVHLLGHRTSNKRIEQNAQGRIGRQAHGRLLMRQDVRLTILAEKKDPPSSI